MKLALKILAAFFVLVLIALVGVYGWASRTDRALLARTIETHRSDFPIPFPLTDAEVDEVRRARVAAGVTGDPMAGVDLDSIARARAMERGRHLVEARYGCVECHGQDFGGGTMVDDPLLGRILGPNITAGAGGRTADYTASDWDRIVRHGVRPDGTPAAMPSVDFKGMADQELSDIVVYIRSRPTVDRTVPPVHLGPLGKVLLATGKLPLSAIQIGDHMASHPVYPPTAEPSVAFGEHLAGTCMGCHGPDLSGGPVAGGDPSWPPAANLTPHTDGLGGWTYDQFVTVLRTGKRPDGTEIRVPMANVLPYARKMTDVELRALWAYLQSIPPVASAK